MSGETPNREQCTHAAAGKCAPAYIRPAAGAVRRQGVDMARTFCVLLLVALAGCSGMPQGIPQGQSAALACAAGEASYACQVERYHNASE
jgi:hypothetical protein